LGVVWKLMSHREGDRRHSPILLISSAVALFAYAVFSYFYIWTTAVASLGCLIVCWVAARPGEYKRDIKNLLIICGGCAAVLVPYAYLLSKRSHTMDDVQLLVRTHAPDLTRFPEYIAGLVILIVFFGLTIRRLEARSPSGLFVISLALAVFVVFNQQVVTGQSLQPIHYQVFIGNYLAGLSLVSAVGLYVRYAEWSNSVAAKTAFSALACLAIGWGFIECHYTVRVLDDANIARDEQVPLGRRLTELAKDDPDKYRTVVLHLSIAEADDLPTLAPQATLWSRHQHVFTSVTTEENKERYYQYLYYQGVTGQELANSIKHGDFVSMIALFGWGRHTDRLNSDFKPLTYGEVDAEARNYDQYVSGFDPHRSPETVVTYLVVRADENPDLTNFDRWYDRDSGEEIGPFTLYRVRLRPEAAN
jgi:hypothetical protein